MRVLRTDLEAIHKKDTAATKSYLVHGCKDVLVHFIFQCVKCGLIGIEDLFLYAAPF